MNALGILLILMWLYMVASVVLWTPGGESEPFLILGTVVVAAVLIAFYPLARFSYDMESDALRISWRIFSVVPLIQKRVELKDVASVRAVPGMGSLIWPPRILVGNPFVARPIVLVAFKHRIVLGLGWAITKHVALTPSDPERFAQTVNARLATSEFGR
jgi:hypothetical protein